MSLSSSIRIPLSWPNIDVFTFGKSSLYGYDSINHCLVFHSPIQINNLNDISNDRLHLSSSPTWPIRRLILNEDETILALLADKIVYLVYLPKSNIQINKTSPSKGSYLCSIIRVPPLTSSSPTITCSLIDFVWLNSNNFVIVYTIPSPSECHLYKVRSSKQVGIEYLQTFSVGSSSINKFGTPNKKISLHQPSDIIKLDVTKRKQKDLELILLFAMKSDGDIFILEIDQNQFLSNENKISEEFQGPILILPSTFNNYGGDHGQSTFICLSNSNYPLVIFTHDKCQLNQSIILSPSLNQYCLFTIDLICLPTNENGQIITSIIRDPFSLNRYFISDSSGNVYSIEISWINQIQQGLKQLQPTHIQHLISGTNSNYKIINKIQQIGLIKTNNNQQYLAIIVKSQINQQKELIFIHSQSLEPIENSLILSESDESKSSLEFIDRIRSLLSRDQSIPYITLSTLSTNISDSDFEKNLSQFIKILTEQYIEKQENVRKELENKQYYLHDYQQTQFNENKQLNEKCEQIQKRFQILREQYQQECSRRKRLSSHVDDLLSIIEQSTPVISDSEIRMQQQLETYQIQINYLKENIQHIQQFILSNQDQEQLDHLYIENIQNFVRNHRNQIDQMKKQLQTIQINK
ncbi:unnamed protein product [Rotaria sordida]|uniref:Uncharacterized protein n=1 Tax=Rotaria sordida TaxID=392033 RepID=A0A815LW78_9BILA|nr:unnamed protein product [Rotaria sordida]